MPFEPKLFDQSGSTNESNAEETSPQTHSLREPDLPVWDDAEQLDLPEDLELLAEQLRDDAIYLAESHPADATPQQREAAWQDFTADQTGNQRRRRVLTGLRIASAAAVFLALAGTAAIWHSRSQNGSGSHHLASQPTPDTYSVARRQNVAQFDAADSAGMPLNVTPVSENPDSVNELPIDQPRLIPAAMLREVTAPELDAMLDLLAEEDSGLSI